MIINETLARGLKDRFFHDFSTEISGAFLEELRSMSLRSGSVKRGKWEVRPGVRGSTGAVFDRSYEGGSKVKPYFVTTANPYWDMFENVPASF